MEQTPLAGVGPGSAEDCFSLTDIRQILYYYKALFTKGQFLHFIATCKRLPDFTSICCTSDFIPVCSVLRLGKLMLFILRRLGWGLVFFIVIHSYFTMIAIELYKLIRQTVMFVKVLYSRVPHPFRSGKASVLWLFVMFAASTLVRQSGDQRGVGWGRCHRSVVAVTAEVRSLSTSSEEYEHHLCTSLMDLRSCCKVKRTISPV